jgi:phosphoglycerol transferase MdoB-like AlkP superfamily enzyme
MVSQANRSFSAYQLTSIILMAAGLGWINGNFVQPVAYAYGITADTIHFIPLVVLILLCLGYSRALGAGKPGTGWNNWLCVHAAFSILTCVVFIILGQMNSDPNSVGVHSFEDLMPVIVLTAGSLLWFATLLLARRPVQISAKQVPNTTTR